MTRAIDVRTDEEKAEIRKLWDRIGDQCPVCECGTTFSDTPAIMTCYRCGEKWHVPLAISRAARGMGTS